VQSGIGTLKQDQLERMTSGRQINMAIETGEGAFTMRALTRPADLADQLKLMSAKFAAPGWDPAPVLRTKAAAILGLRTADSSPRDVVGRELGQYLHGGDKRWASPGQADAEALTPEAFRAFWEPALATGPIELSIFGDFDPDLGHRPEREHYVLGLRDIAAIEFVGSIDVSETAAALLDT
jgi:zinc protease